MKMIRLANIPAERRITEAVIAGGLFSGLLVLFLVSPANLPLPACVFHSVTGHSCLTCGMTRSLHAMSHGDLKAAVGYHLFGPMVFLGMLLSLTVFAAEAVSGKKFLLCTGGKIRNRVVGLFAVLWLVYWGVRLVAECIA
jgi:hypothetical protein